MPTQHYEAPSGKSGKRFVGILYVELDGIHDRKWNVERVIVFNLLSSSIPYPSTDPVQFYIQDSHKSLPDFPGRCVIALL